MKAKRKRQLSRRQDEEVADGLQGGRVQPASGSIAGYKSDAKVTLRLRIETKWTTKESFRLTRADLDKIRGECQWTETPVVVIDFKNNKTGRTEDRWVCVPHKDWEKLANASLDNSRSEDRL